MTAHHRERHALDQMIEGFVRCTHGTELAASTIHARAARAILACMIRMRDIPRTDPFWANTNDEVTFGKIPKFCERALRDDPEDMQAMWAVVGTDLFEGDEFRPGAWRVLVEAHQVELNDVAEAASSMYLASGRETEGDLVSFIVDLGIDGRQFLGDLLRRKQVHGTRSDVAFIERALTMYERRKPA